MSVLIQIRNVPDDVRRTLEGRAAKAGMSLSGYLGQEMARLAADRTWEEMAEHGRRTAALTQEFIAP